MIIIRKFLFNFTNSCGTYKYIYTYIYIYIYIYLTKLLTSSILFSTAVNAEVVAKPIIIGVLFFISVILTLQSNFLTIPLVSGISFSKSGLSVPYLIFKTNSLVSILFTLATNLS